MSNKFLYKYRCIENINRDLKCLEENYFWASKIEELNDEQECFYNNKALTEMLDAVPMLFPNHKGSITRVKDAFEILEQSIKNVGVFSLSRNAVIPSMWASYASDMRGYCIIYDKERLLKSTTPIYHNNLHLFDVAYTAEVPQISMKDMNNDRLLIKKVATKHLSWRHEEETRIVADNCGKHEHLPSAIHGIIFGTKMIEENKAKIKNALVGRNVKFYQLYKNEAAYGYSYGFVDEYCISFPFSEDMYTFKVYSTPVVDNYYVKINFKPKGKDEIVSFIKAFKQKYTERQHNFYLHDCDTDVNRLTPSNDNYDYLQNHLIAETMIECNEIFFSHKYM